MALPLKILVVEDEYITLKTISVYLNEMGYDVVGTAMNADEAIEILDSNEIEFALLDITIQGEKNGIWLADYIQQNYNIPHVFLTAYSDNNTIKKAISTNPSGYLIKPFQKAELFSAIEIAILNFNKNQSSKEKHLLVKHNEIYTKINFDSILFIESDKNYLIITCNNETYRYRSTITDFENLMPHNFIKTHKGFIINCDKVKEFSTSLVLINEFKIPISKTFKELVFNKLQ